MPNRKHVIVAFILLAAMAILIWGAFFRLNDKTHDPNNLEQKNPSFEEAMAKPESLWQAGEREESLAHFLKAAALYPDEPRARVARAAALISLSRYAQARDLLEQDLRAFPQHRVLQAYLARILAAGPDRLRDGPKALQIAANLTAAGVDRAGAEIAAMAHAETGRFDEAVTWQQRAVVLAREQGADAALPHLLHHLQLYVERQACRQPWPVGEPLPFPASHARSDATARGPNAPGLAMTHRLALIAENIEPSKVSYLNKERAIQMGEQLQGERDINRFLALQPQYARELQRAGQSGAAIQAFEHLRRVITENGVPFEGEGKRWLLHELALSYLRLGEQENCQINHTAESCLLPIREAGIHRLSRGSRGAIAVYTEILDEFPDDLKAKWLLNIAHMTLGEHPDGVVPKRRIDPKVFASGEDFPRFVDVGPKTGLDVDGLSGGGIVEDFDNDGDLDVMVSSWGLRDPMHYLVNQGDGSFQDRSEAAGLNDLTGGLNMMQTDYNNDGFADVFVLRGAWMGAEGGHPNSLLRNNGDGSFSDVTEPAGILSFHPTQTATWFDYNNDGWLDVFIGNETTEDASHPCELYRNNGDGSFSECAAAAGVAVVGFVKGVTSGDFDNDGTTDLYISRYTQPNLLYRNLGAESGWRFEDVTATAGVAEPVLSFPTWFWDYDNDGNLDLFVSDYENRGVETPAADYLGLAHHGERARLYRNRGDGSFEDVTRQVGLFRVLIAMGSNFGDVDNDGWLDFYLGTGTPSLSMLIPNRMFRNREGQSFADITSAGGFGHIQKGHGVSFADIDHDGDQDVHIVMGGAYSGDNYRNALFENPGNENRWLKLKLVGRTSNRAGIGARIKIEIQTAAGIRNIHRVVGTGGSFGASPLRQEIGLGQAEALRRVRVFWPVTGREQVWAKLQMNRCYRLEEDRDQVTEINLKTFQLGTSDHALHHD